MGPVNKAPAGRHSETVRMPDLSSDFDVGVDHVGWWTAVQHGCPASSMHDDSGH